MAFVYKKNKLIEKTELLDRVNLKLLILSVITTIFKKVFVY